MSVDDDTVPFTGNLSWECFTGWCIECPATSEECWCQRPGCTHPADDEEEGK